MKSYRSNPSLRELFSVSYCRLTHTVHQYLWSQSELSVWFQRVEKGGNSWSGSVQPAPLKIQEVTAHGQEVVLQLNQYIQAQV